MSRLTSTSSPTTPTECERRAIGPRQLLGHNDSYLGLFQRRRHATVLLMSVSAPGRSSACQPHAPKAGWKGNAQDHLRFRTSIQATRPTPTTGKIDSSPGPPVDALARRRRAFLVHRLAPAR